MRTSGLLPELATTPYFPGIRLKFPPPHFFTSRDSKMDIVSEKASEVQVWGNNRTSYVYILALFCT